ncbi:unnamed protein product [Phytophthora fragariaefolia]|uniref:Unnamed protein product n=1 Tax=Phytophthora fragariaefolia TaxID=1490495 RepID=A0A9W6X4P7_9STRA|nr:unnamed protein product [Phytophthora fragariaefolia]
MAPTCEFLDEKKPPAMLTSVAVVCQKWPPLRDHRVLKRVQAFLDWSTTISLAEACSKPSLRLVQRVFSRRKWGRQSIADGLCCAASKGELNIVEYLCEMGEKQTKLPIKLLVNTKDASRRDALLEAVCNGHMAVVQWLVNNGAKLTEQDRRGRTVMILAAEMGNLAVLQFLVEKGVGVGETYQLGRTALHAAAEYGHFVVVKWLVEKGAQVNGQDRNNRAPLSLAAEGGHLPVVELLLQNGANVDDTDRESQKTALHYAAGRGHLAVVQSLVAHGANMNKFDRYLQTPVYLAVGRGNVAVVQWFIDNGARVAGASTEGRTALNNAALNGHILMVRFLMKMGFDAFCSAASGHTTLYYATTGHQLQVVEYILVEGRDREMPQPELWEALFSAANDSCTNIIDILHQSYWNRICEPNSQGTTILHEAVARGLMKPIQQLVIRGADIHQRDPFGLTPFIEACRHRHHGIINFLLDAGAHIEDANFAIRTGLHYSAEAGLSDVVELLLSRGACADFPDKLGWTALHVAAATGQLSAVKVLHRHNATMNVQTATGKTALVVAVEAGQSGVSDYLVELNASTKMPIADAEAPFIDFKEYILDPSEVHFKTLQDNSEAVWLNSPTEIKIKRGGWSQSFVEELRRWSALNHPHLVKLYGVCYGREVRDPVFVYERATNGTLLEFIGDSKNPSRKSLLWDKLYEAALGLQYLHDRNVVHGEVNCDSIVIAASGVAKLRNIGKDSVASDLRLPWIAPELLSGFPRSFESDIYAFGVVILEACKAIGEWPCTALTPWNVFHMKSAYYSIAADMFSYKPSSMTETQWKLVKRMCSYDPRDRISAADLVRELEVFTHTYESQREGCESYSTLFSSSELSDASIDERSLSTISSVLKDLDNMCGETCPIELMHRDAYNRLTDVLSQLKSRQDQPDMELIQRYSALLHSFQARLLSTTAVGLAQATLLAVSRQSANIVFSVHTDLDSFIDSANLSRSSPVHDWRNKWMLRRKQQQHDMLQKIENLPRLMDELKDRKQREIALGYLRFELSKYAASYATIEAPGLSRAKSVVASLVTGEDNSWFIPAYEVEFDKFDEFSRGAFGKVYHGRWKRSRVVVKKLKLRNEEDEAALLNEVDIWHKLYHPHIVQLFGACHINQPFFVCEYAGGGQLNLFLRKYPSAVWDKLYEAALGLRYLHRKHVIHGDLKCNNILVGSDGRAKLTDFGLSFLGLDSQPCSDNGTDALPMEVPRIGAIRWKAPEVLRGEKATYASDIYSFGMCVLEAVSGAFPWGVVIPDIAVKHHVLKSKRIPVCPDNCSHEAYQLIKEMCRFVPSERMTINNVVKAINLLR